MRTGTPQKKNTLVPTKRNRAGPIPTGAFQVCPFNSGTGKGQGMMFKKALHYLFSPSLPKSILSGNKVVLLKSKKPVMPATVTDKQFSCLYLNS